MNSTSNENIEKKRPFWIKLIGAIVLIFILLFVMNFIVKKEIAALIKKSEISQESQQSTSINSQNK